MTLVTLQRQAPVAPNVSSCRLCDQPIGGRVQDDLLVGQPGLAEVRAVICTGCGTAVEGLVALCGNDLSIVVRGDRRVEPAPSSELDHTRQRLSQEADSLGRTAQTLRSEAEKLSRLDS